MSVRKIMLGVAAGALGLGALLFSRGKERPEPASSQRPGWVRATALASGVDHPLGLAIDGDYVYFVSGGFANAENAVRRVHTTGGSVETLAKVEQLVSGELVVDSDYVYFTSEWGNTVLRVPKNGGAATVLAQAPAPTFLAADASHVYFVTFAKQEPGGTVQRVPKTGGPAEVLVSGHPGLDNLVVDDRDVFFRSNKGLWRVAKAGGAAQNILPRSERQNVGRLAADAAYLYFFLETSSSGKYAVARLSKNGGAPETIGPIGNPTARLALSDSHVYFFREANLTEDALAKVPKAGGPAETVDGSGHSTGHLTVVGGNVYFTDINTVYRAPK